MTFFGSLIGWSCEGSNVNRWKIIQPANFPIHDMTISNSFFGPLNQDTISIAIGIRVCYIYHYLSILTMDHKHQANIGSLSIPYVHVSYRIASTQARDRCVAICLGGHGASWDSFHWSGSPNLKEVKFSKETSDRYGWLYPQYWKLD